MPECVKPLTYSPSDESVLEYISSLKTDVNVSKEKILLAPNNPRSINACGIVFSQININLFHIPE